MPVQGLLCSPAQPEPFRFSEHRRENGQGAVRRCGDAMQAGEPALHLAGGDVGDGALAEERQDLVAQVGAVDGTRAGLPNARQALDDERGHRLEQRPRLFMRGIVRHDANRPGCCGSPIRSAAAPSAGAMKLHDAGSLWRQTIENE